MFFRCPLIFVLLAYCCGILCAGSMVTEPCRTVIPDTLAGVLLAMGLVAAAAAVRLQGVHGRMLAWAALLLSCAAGVAEVGQRNLSHGPLAGEPAWFTGRVCGRPSVNRRDTVLLVDLESGPTPGLPRLRLSYPTEPHAPGSRHGPPTEGQRISFFAGLRRPHAFGNPGGFDYQRYLASRGMGLTARLKSGRLVHRLSSTPADPATALCRWVERAVWSGDGTDGTVGLQSAEALLVACLVGERRWIEPEDEEILRRSGLGHLLAISGLHLGLLGLLLSGFLSAIRVPIRVRRLGLIFFFIAYHELCGAKPSITRAMITAVVYLSGGVLAVHPRPVNILAAAGLAILALNPLMIHDAGFQLSFGATFSILLLGPTCCIPRRHGSQPGWRSSARLVLGLIGVSTAVLLGIAPLQARLFHRATPGVLLANPLAGPLLGLSLTAGLILLATTALGALTPPCCIQLLQAVIQGARGLVDFCFGAILWLARQTAPLSFRLPAPAPAVMWAYYLCLGTAALVSRRGRRGRQGVAVLLLLCGAPCLLLAGAATGGRWLPDGSVRVTFLDVGQGDATIIECSHRRALVIDGGGALSGGGFDFGEMAVSPALWDLGLHSVEDVAVSHGHQDHAAGLPAVVRNFRPLRILAGARLSMGLSAVRALKTAGEECGSRLVPLHRGMVIRKGEVELVVLHPPPPAAVATEAGPNNNSLVLLLRHRRVRMLFTGDLENHGEEVLLGSPLSRLIAGCRLLKVGHHGAPDASSPRWLRLISPRTAVITAGRYNRFGHPDPLLHHKLRHAGCRRIHCTGRDGALVVISDGRRLYHRSGPF